MDSYLVPTTVMFHFRNSFYQLVCPYKYTDWCLELNSYGNSLRVFAVLSQSSFKSPALLDLVPNSKPQRISALVFRAPTVPRVGFRDPVAPTWRCFKIQESSVLYFQNQKQKAPSREVRHRRSGSLGGPPGVFEDGGGRKCQDFRSACGEMADVARRHLPV